MTEIDLEAENKAIAKEYKELLRISYQTLSEDDKKIIVVKNLESFSGRCS